MLYLKNISKSFGDKVILNNLNLEVKDGEITANPTINPNGKEPIRVQQKICKVIFAPSNNDGNTSIT